MDYLKYKNYKIPALVAISAEEQKKGLMFREDLPPLMIFPYVEPKQNFFWMNNVSQPLDIIYCLKNKIVAIHQGEPYSTKLIGGNELSDLVLEMPYGNCRKMGMRLGDDIEIEYEPKSISKILLSNSLNY